MWQRLVNCIERRNSKLYIYKVSYTSLHSGKKKRKQKKKGKERENGHLSLQKAITDTPALYL